MKCLVLPNYQPSHTLTLILNLLDGAEPSLCAIRDEDPCYKVLEYVLRETNNVSVLCLSLNNYLPSDGELLEEIHNEGTGL